MGFNELNSVEHYIIHQLCGVNLNNIEVHDSKSAYGAQWVYKTSDEIHRGVIEVYSIRTWDYFVSPLAPKSTLKP